MFTYKEFIALFNRLYRCEQTCFIGGFMRQLYRRKEQFFFTIISFNIFSDLWVRNDNDNPIILTNRLLIQHTAYHKCQTNISVFPKKMDRYKALLPRSQTSMLPETCSSPMYEE